MHAPLSLPSNFALGQALTLEVDFPFLKIQLIFSRFFFILPHGKIN